MMGNYYDYGFGSMFGFGWLFMVVFWGLVIWGIVSLVRGANSDSGSSGDGRKEALSILKERYAKGEIDKKEFEEKKKDLLS